MQRTCFLGLRFAGMAQRGPQRTYRRRRIKGVCDPPSLAKKHAPDVYGGVLCAAAGLFWLIGGLAARARRACLDPNILFRKRLELYMEESSLRVVGPRTPTATLPNSVIPISDRLRQERPPKVSGSRRT